MHTVWRNLPQAGRDIYDLGESLYAFLLRYGEEFDYETEAVSVASGGIVSKRVRGALRSVQFLLSFLRGLCGCLTVRGRQSVRAVIRVDWWRGMWKSIP